MRKSNGDVMETWKFAFQHMNWFQLIIIGTVALGTMVLIWRMVSQPNYDPDTQDFLKQMADQRAAYEVHPYPISPNAFPYPIPEDGVPPFIEPAPDPVAEKPKFASPFSYEDLQQNCETLRKIIDRMNMDIGTSRTAHSEQVARLRADRAEAVRDKMHAYEERARVVAALAVFYPAGKRRTDIPGWNDKWHGCVYVDLPTGQVSWHYHDDHAFLFEHLPRYRRKWDGHTTPDKYARLNEFATTYEMK
jgi:hypothetical protein